MQLILRKNPGSRRMSRHLADQLTCRGRDAGHRYMSLAHHRLLQLSMTTGSGSDHKATF